MAFQVIYLFIAFKASWCSKDQYDWQAASVLAFFSICKRWWEDCQLLWKEWSGEVKGKKQEMGRLEPKKGSYPIRHGEIQLKSTGLQVDITTCLMNLVQTYFWNWFWKCPWLEKNEVEYGLNLKFFFCWHKGFGCGVCALDVDAIMQCSGGQKFKFNSFPDFVLLWPTA